MNVLMFIFRCSSVDVSAYVRLSAGADGHGDGGLFNVSTMCPGSHLNLRFLDAPLFSTLKLDAVSQTAMINLHSGDFDQVAKLYDVV